MLFLNILKFKIRLGSASTKNVLISLIFYHESVLYSLISYHELKNLNCHFYQFKISVNVIAIVKQSIRSYKLTKYSMYTGSKSSKRPREEPPSSISTNNHSKRDRANTSSSNSNSGTSSSKSGRDRARPEPMDRACPMCSDSRGTIRHYHYSSTEIRRMFLDQGTQTTYPCPICHELEPVVVPPMEVRRIVLADSTLHGVWNQTLPNNILHFDIDVIVGGKVRDLTRAFEKNYQHIPNRMEIVVVAGLNNIGAGETADQIIREMEDLKHVVGEHSRRWNHNPPSYVVFCTLLFPPKFCSLHLPASTGSDLANPEIAEWIPQPSFNNRYLETRKLNDLIISKNKEGGQQLIPVRLDYVGIKRFKSGVFQHRFDNKEGATAIWKEKEVFRKLHLTMENKVKVITNISNCFKGNVQSNPVQD